jgi:hypothetical protein
LGDLEIAIEKNEVDKILIPIDKILNSDKEI